MLQVWFRQASIVPNAKLDALARGKSLVPRNTSDLSGKGFLRFQKHASVELRLVPFPLLAPISHYLVLHRLNYSFSQRRELES